MRGQQEHDDAQVQLQARGLLGNLEWMVERQDWPGGCVSGIAGAIRFAPIVVLPKGVLQCYRGTKKVYLTGE